MFKMMNGVMTYVPGTPGPCELCGTEVKERQPYGPDNKKICLACADANIDTVLPRMMAHLEQVLTDKS